MTPEGQINGKIGENPIPKSKASCLGLVSGVEGWLRVFSREFISIEIISNLLSEVSYNSPLKGGSFSSRN